ncbi:MAG: hypothetical protein NC081_09845 [Roseburia sp.]|nr:hypothetical protein [Roseburia sp.]
MRKKIGSLAALFCLCLFLLPMSVKAAGGKNFDDAKTIKGEKNYSFTFEESESCYMLYRVPDTGYFSFDLSSTRDYWLGSVTVTVYDSTYRKIDEIKADNTSSQSHYYNMKKGQKVYFVLKSDVYSKHKVTAKFKVKHKKASNWEQEFNDTRQKATTLKSGKTLFGTSLGKSSGLDVDFYKYKVENTGFFTLDFQTLSNENSSFKVALYYKNNDAPFAEYSYISEKLVTPKFNFKKGTTIYIKVFNNAYGTNNNRYKLRVKFNKSNKWEQEDNDTMTRATKLALKSTLKGNFLNAKDVDYYKVKATKSGTLKISFKGTADVNSLEGWKLTVYDSSKKQIAQAENILYSKNLKAKVKKGKTYYVKLEAQSTYWCKVAGTDYSLKASY